MEFNHIIKKYRNIVDKELNIFFGNKINNAKDKFLRECYRYIKEFSLREGKRIRPIAAIMAYKAVNDFGEEKIYPVSIVPELIHASTLIHDDVMDEDFLRRNRDTMHKIFEKYFKKNFSDTDYNGDLFSSYSKRFSLSMAILQGNIVNLLSNSCILESKLDENKKNKAIGIFNDAYCKTNEGQILDLLISAKGKAAEEDYIMMALCKTGPLISASVKFGAMLNDAKDFQIDALGGYANSVAIAFQIYDDIMDLGNAIGKGRKIGTDVRKGNKTMIVVKALGKCNEEQKELLLSVLGNYNALDSDIKGFIGVIKDTGALDYAKEYANKKIIEAKEYIKKANLNEEGNGFFNEFAEYAASRNT